MNLRIITLAILAFNASSYAEKGHHHHHHRSDYHTLVKAERAELIDIIYSKYDENHALKSEITNLKNGLIPHRNKIIGWSAFAGAAGAVTIYALVKLWANC